MEAIEISTLIAIAGCAIGVSGWLSGRQKVAADDGHWRGGVDAKLDDIKTSVNNTSADLAGINKELKSQGERLTAVEESSKSAHHRIDELIDVKK